MVGKPVTTLQRNKKNMFNFIEVGLNLDINFSLQYTCQLSRLRVENFDLTPAHACGPISHA